MKYNEGLYYIPFICKTNKKRQATIGEILSVEGRINSGKGIGIKFNKNSLVEDDGVVYVTFTDEQSYRLGKGYINYTFKAYFEDKDSRDGTYEVTRTVQINEVFDGIYDPDIIQGGSGEVDMATLQIMLSSKVNSTDVYVKNEIDGKLNDKANASSVYTKDTVDDKLANKANASSVYTKDNTYNKTEVDAKIAEVAAGEIDLAAYAKKTELPTKVSQLANDANYLTSHQDLTTYAKKVEIPTKVSQLTNDSGYLTTHQDLSAYATIQIVDTKIAQAVIDGDIDLSNYYTKAESDEKYVTQEDIANKVDSSELEAYYTKAQVDTKIVEAVTDGAIDLEGYAKTTDIPTNVSELTNDSGFITSTDIADKANRSELDGYAAKDEIPTKISQLTNDTNYITETAIEGKADKSEVYTKEQADEKYITSTSTVFANKADKGESYTKSESDGKYLTTHQSLASYAKKVEIPTKVSQLDNDANYLTATDIEVKANKTDVYTKLESDGKYLTTHQSLAEYARIENIPRNVSELANDSEFITATAIEGKADKSEVYTKVESDGKYVKSEKNVYLTQAAYDALTAKDAETTYYIYQE